MDLSHRMSLELLRHLNQFSLSIYLQICSAMYANIFFFQLREHFPIMAKICRIIHKHNQIHLTISTQYKMMR